jgi:L-iditol 2-dehydrogenase
MCKHFKETNIIPGGFSEYIYLSEEHLKNVAFKVPNNLTNLEASFYEPLGCCIRAVKRADLKEKSKVLVIGLGSIGILMGEALSAYGMEVFGCDIIEERIDFASRFNIKAFHSSKIKEKIFLSTENITADAVFMTSGADAAIELALKAVRSGGKIIVFSSTPKNFAYANNEIYYRELMVMGSYSPAPSDLKDSINMLADNQVRVENISTVYDFADIEQAFYDTINNSILKAYIKINN